MTNNSDLLLNIVKLNRSAENQYNELIKLEIEGKINTEEYKQIKENIKLIATVLTKDYISLLSDPDAFIDSGENLYQLNNLKDSNYVEHIIEFKPLNRIIRTLLHFYYLAFRYNIYSLNIPAGEEDDDFGYFEDDIDYQEELEQINEETEEYLRQADEIERLKEELIAYTLYDRVRRYIKKAKNPKLKEKLIIMKYNLIYSFIPLEENFLSTNLYVSRAQEIKEELQSKLVELDDVQVHNVLEYQIDKAIDDLLDYTDDDYQNVEKFITIKLKTAIAKVLNDIEEETKVKRKLEEKRKMIYRQLRKEKKNRTIELMKKTFKDQHKNAANNIAEFVRKKIKPTRVS